MKTAEETAALLARITAESKRISDDLLKRYVRRGSKWICATSPEGLLVLAAVTGRGQCRSPSDFESFEQCVHGVLMWHSLCHDISGVSFRFVDAAYVESLGLSKNTAAARKFSKEVEAVLASQPGMGK